MLSTAPVEDVNNDSSHRLLDSDHTPIKLLDGNPAYMDGVLCEVNLSLKRDGKFTAFIEQHALPLSNGKTAIYSSHTIPFMLGTIANPVVYTFRNMCPPGVLRVTEHNNITGVTPIVAQATVTAAESATFVINPYKLQETGRNLCKLLVSVVEDTYMADE